MPMHVAPSSASRVPLQGLLDAMAQAHADDSLINPLTPAQWEVLAPYLQPCVLALSQVLFNQGVSDRTLYFLESGSLSVHYEDAKGRLRLALVTPGSVVGEGGFFSQRPRTATVQAAAPAKLWGLSALRLTELSNRQPAVALNVAMAAGAVLAKRMTNRRRRIATT